MKILVVEDEYPMQVLIKKYLNRLGYMEVLITDNGNIALEILQKKDIQLIISDWDMPVMSGLAFLEKVRIAPSYSRIPFLMVTAHKDKGSVVQAFKSGVNSYIVKPFKFEILEEKIKEMLRLNSQII